eukprot:TRINITY_DN10934_c0_g1_i2.p1 TRINITY_DN10934_c0_g1~~TRINITY_DN10934_c0_g1_i2.p1  ORF type:complete len:883 (+),score=143.46 TRINITY_DN10934_c0_g1_i2:35-2650(+)
MVAESVVVGVRIRPFNQREEELGAELCIEMDEHTTVIIDPDSQKKSTFTFDRSLWSFDGFEDDGTGYLRPLPGSRYADQSKVFDIFGRRVINNAWKGYHCTLFAYGQTGAGKSYSMVGYGKNRGIVPISCEEIFKRIAENDDPSRRFEILVSMVEIYNECVHDLTLDPNDRLEGGLKVRESKALGVYIDGVRKQAVESYAAIEKVMDEAASHRTLGATLMNATSSRGHTVTSIEFKQVERVGKTDSVKLSIINLVDLAGSEKAAQTGATGDRLKEGALINKSLSALGAVISKLAEKSTAKKGAKESVSVPYRDSKLTRLLSNALGGSSKTIMICALSPASSNFQETISTLRYADRAKQIKNTAVVNENPQDKLIREMREENAKLKAMIESGGAMVDASLILEKQEELAQLARILEESKRSFEERLEERRVEELHRHDRCVIFDHPQLVNLNEQVQLSCRLRYELTPGSFFRVCSGAEHSSGEENEDDRSEDTGSSKASEDSEDVPATIVIPGHVVLDKHARISCIGDRQCFLICSEFSAQMTWVNGVSLFDLQSRHLPEDLPSRLKYRRQESDRFVTELKHGDYVTFGRAMFLFADPREGLPESMIISGEASFHKAKKQLPPTWKRETSKFGLCGDDSDGSLHSASSKSLQEESGGNLTRSADRDDRDPSKAGLSFHDREKEAFQGEIDSLRSDLHLAQKDRNASEDARKKAENECAVLRQQLKAANEARKRAEQCARGAEAWTKEQPERLPPSVLPNDNSDELTKNDSALVMAKDAQIAELQNQVKELNKALSLRRREKCLESPRQREAMDGQGADSFYPTDGWADLSGLTTTIKTSFDDAISALDSAQFYLDRNSSSAAVPKRHTHLVF